MVKNKIVLSFTDFVNESFNDEDFTYYIEKYRRVFIDFFFEAPIFEKIDQISAKWNLLKKKYNWNREIRDFKKDHFSLDVKIYKLPTLDKAREILNDQNLTETQLGNLWWNWIELQREVYLSDLEYPWMEKILGFGGKSGGWLVIEPNHSSQDAVETLDELLGHYEADKEDSAEDNDDYLEYLNYSKDPDIVELMKVGLIQGPPEIQKLHDAANNIIKWLNEELEWLIGLETGLASLAETISEFKENAVNLFYEDLREQELINQSETN